MRLQPVGVQRFFPLWASGTAGNAGAELVVQNDGNVVVYSAAGAALWATGTNGK